MNTHVANALDAAPTRRTPSPSAPGWARWLALGCVLALTPAARALAQEATRDNAPRPIELRFVLPLELAQGPRFDGADDGFAWLGSASLLPGIAFGDAELSALAAGAFLGDSGEALFGARVSYVFLPIAEHTISIRLGLQGAYGVVAAAPDGAVGLLGDLAGILRLGLWAGRDFGTEHFYVLVSVGTDFMTWSDPVGSIVQAGPMEDVGRGR